MHYQYYHYTVNDWSRLLWLIDLLRPLILHFRACSHHKNKIQYLFKTTRGQKCGRWEVQEGSETFNLDVQDTWVRRPHTPTHKAKYEDCFSMLTISQTGEAAGLRGQWSSSTFLCRPGPSDFLGGSVHVECGPPGQISFPPVGSGTSGN